MRMCRFERLRCLRTPQVRSDQQWKIACGMCCHSECSRSRPAAAWIQPGPFGKSVTLHGSRYKRRTCGTTRFSLSVFPKQPCTPSLDQQTWVSPVSEALPCPKAAVGETWGGGRAPRSSSFNLHSTLHYA